MKRGDELRCRDCPARTTWRRKELPDSWLVVLDPPPYALCGECNAAVQRAALGRSS